MPRLWRWVHGWLHRVRVLPQAGEFMAQACRAAQPGTGHLWLSIADEAATHPEPAGIYRHHKAANAADEGYVELEVGTMSDAEKEIIALTALLWNKFLALPHRHPSDAEEMQRDIHAIQNRVMARVAVRSDPSTFLGAEWHTTTTTGG